MPRPEGDRVSSVLGEGGVSRSYGMRRGARDEVE